MRIRRKSVKHTKRKRKGGSTRKYNRKSSLVVIKAPWICPDRIMVKMTYPFIYHSNPGTYNEISMYRGNSIFAPDLGFAYQPLGFAQWAAFYKYFRVLSSQISVVFLSDMTLDNILISILPTLKNTGPTSFLASFAEPYSGFTTLGLSTGDGRGRRIVKSMSTRKMFGVPNPVDDNYYGTATANPADLWYWAVTASVVDATSNLVVDWIGKITYFVEWSDRNELTVTTHA